MKRYASVACLALLASCSTTPDLTIEQQTVEAYVTLGVNDPSSYEAVRWGKAAAYTRRDSVKAAIQPMLDDMNTFATQKGYIDKVLTSPAFTDTTRIATALTHTYRSKNKLGALVLDSARFVVYPTGKVVRL